MKKIELSEELNDNLQKFLEKFKRETTEERLVIFCCAYFIICAKGDISFDCVGNQRCS